ncbi:MAG TPA: clostripain-related cysteine peptidase [Pyrinomonadaceae bacterium]|nr:clostripain-related cysteine peptidase [Pyrinomonadaceae bacterium]
MQTKEWTLMFYFASDNPLASTIVSQLKALKEAGYHPQANVIAQFDPHAVNTPVHVFDVHHVNKFWFPGHKEEAGFTHKDPFVRDLVFDRLWGEKDEPIRKMVADYVEQGMPKGVKFDPPKPYPAMSGEQDPKEALTNFLSFCRESYPARHYLLFILGHGQVVGNDTLLLDNHANRHALTLTELGQVLRCFNADVGTDSEPGQVEMITLHSCSMSAMEVAYELKGAANYMLGSQGPMYVGNLPYKQILTRVFDDLEAMDEDVSQNGNSNSVDRSARSTFLRGKIPNEAVTTMGRYAHEAQHHHKRISAIVDDFETMRNGDNEEILELGARSITEMLHKMYFDCLYNSYDFQLAGYPFDMCLTDLSKVGETKDPIDQLAESLIAGLQDKNPTPKQLILLAHWDAQSFYNEDYVDFYDFCFCLRRRCEERSEDLSTIQSLQDIYSACQDVITVLEKGNHKLINLSSFCGAAFQYSHGHSIYFPWAKPVDGKLFSVQYAEYRISRETKWKQFLNVYFEKTMRKTRAEETGFTVQKGETQEIQLKKKILALIGLIGANALSADGRLQKPGPDHPTGKYGPDDPSGVVCDCQIKNYPSFTGEILTDKGEKVRIHLDEDFLDGTTIPIGRTET